MQLQGEGLWGGGAVEDEGVVGRAGKSVVHVPLMDRTQGGRIFG